MVFVLSQSLHLSDLPIGVDAEVSAVRLPEESEQAGHDRHDILLRLIEIGFVPGERVRVVAVGHPGREPIAVRLGGTTFALRRFEAEQIQVQVLANLASAAVAGVAS